MLSLAWKWLSYSEAKRGWPLLYAFEKIIRMLSGITSSSLLHWLWILSEGRSATFLGSSSVGEVSLCFFLQGSTKEAQKYSKWKYFFLKTICKTVPRFLIWFLWNLFFNFYWDKSSLNRLFSRDQQIFSPLFRFSFLIMRSSIHILTMLSVARLQLSEVDRWKGKIISSCLIAT